MNLPSAPFLSPFRSLLRGWLLSFLGWGILAFALGSHFVSQTGVSWSEAVQVSMRNWLPWAILTPLLIRLVARLPLDRGAFEGGAARASGLLPRHAGGVRGLVE